MSPSIIDSIMCLITLSYVTFPITLYKLPPSQYGSTIARYFYFRQKKYSFAFKTFLCFWLEYISAYLMALYMILSTTATSLIAQISFVGDKTLKTLANPPSPINLRTVHSLILVTYIAI